MNKSDDNGMDREQDELMSMARRLPEGVAPQRDLWPGVAEAIIVDRRRASFRWNRALAQAAAVILLVGGSSGITWFAMKQNAQTPAQTFEAQPLALQPVSGNFGSDYHLGAEFMEARNDLASRLEQRLQTLPQETQTDVRRNIVRIRAAINEINLALAEEPHNSLLQELLLSSYREELTVMRRVEGLASSAMRRTDI
ncbi:MAG: hypothetical protein WD448_11010 [Woeseia sp.]